MSDKTILLVEDDPDDVELTLRVLKNHNVANDVVVTRDGAEALDYLSGTGVYAARDPTHIPAAVLLDLKLPKVDGLEVLCRLRADPRTQLVPVVILTSSKEEQDLVTSYELGCNSYVRKPVQFAEFTAAVRQLGMYWLLLNKPPPSEEEN